MVALAAALAAAGVRILYQDGTLTWSDLVLLVQRQDGGLRLERGAILHEGAGLPTRRLAVHDVDVGHIPVVAEDHAERLLLDVLGQVPDKQLVGPANGCGWRRWRVVASEATYGMGQLGLASERAAPTFTSTHEDGRRCHSAEATFAPAFVTSSALSGPRHADRGRAVISEAVDAVQGVHSALCGIGIVVDDEGAALSRGRLALHDVDVGGAAIGVEDNCQLVDGNLLRQAAHEEFVLARHRNLKQPVGPLRPG
eukprot:CAMPEP_0177329118 /NCGR_PEP_ID=MMETSP0368-20130122/19805_1 /TAXON_ID=447022 ORGANISM="Scrippsiella hangoei-like, Strain SHHI-4" /NCGR_SAMPLE_ID=MMETSP0368 /ASSEMBLY_ACC=CAM_ASM_000363 /LENGTH=253 /DNA_ID=CAMNT_0018789329 /DNA_START=161 /DNA_END=922 /DNA_ORIENTATION=+